MIKRLFLLGMIFVLTGCSSSTGKGTSEEDIQVINDKVFVEYTNDMFYNPEQYSGFHIELEGVIYMDYFFLAEGEPFVVRQVPGCCGADGYAGLQITYDGEIPEEGTWVTAKGVWSLNYDLAKWTLDVYSLEETDEGDLFLLH